MEKTSYYTEKGLQQLKAELQDLRTKGRKQIAEQLAEARAKGDISENAEYESAKESQELLEIKIRNLERTLANAQILSKHDIDTSRAFILSRVTIRDRRQEKTVVYTIVAEEEADLKAGKISVNSPMGKGLLGKRVGETATVDTPSGRLEFDVLDISI